MGMRYGITRIKTGKYRYRGHIIWHRDFRYWCAPDPSDISVCGNTLREVVSFIDRWEVAFVEGRANGNFIGLSEDTAQLLLKRILEFNQSLRETNSMLAKMSSRLIQFRVEGVVGDELERIEKDLGIEKQ